MGSKRNPRSRRARRGAARVSAPRAAAPRSRASSVGSPVSSPSSARVASLHDTARRASLARLVETASAEGPASRSVSPSRVQAAVARMRFSVRVPVLSVQITEVEPRVSTALRRLTSAPRRARTRTPTARARVMVGRSPSGTLATSRPMANSRASPSGSPAANVPSSRKSAPADTATIAISQATRLTWISSGLSSRSTRWDRAAMRPSSVRIPVAKTRPRPSPAVQVVPLKTRSAASSGDAACATRFAAR